VSAFSTDLGELTPFDVGSIGVGVPAGTNAAARPGVSIASCGRSANEAEFGSNGRRAGARTAVVRAAAAEFR
jgi:hypothetical protein